MRVAATAGAAGLADPEREVRPAFAGVSTAATAPPPSRVRSLRLRVRRKIAALAADP